MTEGLLLVNKPIDWTSFDVVNYTRKAVAEVDHLKPKQIKVGHSGTLDPFASGLLILLIGKVYTARASQFLKLDKTYELMTMLGSNSTTGDPEGKLTTVSDTKPSHEQVMTAISKFKGVIEQTPPIYSALKVKGQPAYKLARAGKPVELEPRRVTIHELKLVHYIYPRIKLVAKVSSGTYIRSLVEDIGKELGTGAYTVDLCRTSIGNFKLQDAISPRSINADSLANRIILM